MPLVLHWPQIALRLALAALAGALIGLDRGERGRPAGLRTTLLVCLAAAVAMIEANLLLPTAGKPGDSFVSMDVMRLPLGILTGMGFIGGGAILRRDGLVLGVTTAATLWFVTILGLCFGTGLFGLGLAGLALGLFVVSGLRRLERRMRQERYGTLSLQVEAPVEPEELRSAMQRTGYNAELYSVAVSRETDRRELDFRISWRAAPQERHVPPFLDSVLNDHRILSARWRANT